MLDWRHWHNEPFLVGGLILLGWLHAVLAGPLRQRLAPGRPYPWGAVLRFQAALLVFYLAVGSPLDQAGERFLLSAHMLQHQLLIYPAALLFLLGLPDWMVRPITGRPALQGLFRVLSRPLVCGLLYTVILTVWHLPFLYEWALRSRPVHIGEHLLFFGAALAFWWPLASPSAEFPPASPPAQMLYVLAVLIGMTPVFAYLTFSHDILYPTYEFAPRLTGLSPAEDQVLAGAMMKLVGFAVGLTAFGAAFHRWHRASAP